MLQANMPRIYQIHLLAGVSEPNILRSLETEEGDVMKRILGNSRIAQTINHETQELVCS